MISKISKNFITFLSLKKLFAVRRIFDTCKSTSVFEHAEFAPISAMLLG